MSHSRPPGEIKKALLQCTVEEIRGGLKLGDSSYGVSEDPPGTFLAVLQAKVQNFAPCPLSVNDADLHDVPHIVDRAAIGCVTAVWLVNATMMVFR